jgi:hypothetical protein
VDDAAQPAGAGDERGVLRGSFAVRAAFSCQRSAFRKGGRSAFRVPRSGAIGMAEI